MSDGDLCGAECVDGSACRHPAGSCPVPSHSDPDAENPQGRDSKLTKERQEGIAAMLEQGHSQAAAARAHGIRPQTISEWTAKGEEHPESIYGEFAERIARAKAKSERDYVTELRHLAREIEDPHTLRWMLQQRFPESWGESDAIGGGASASPIEIYTTAETDGETVEHGDGG